MCRIGLSRPGRKHKYWPPRDACCPICVEEWVRELVRIEKNEEKINEARRRLPL